MTEKKRNTGLKALKVFLITLTIFVGVQIIGRLLLNSSLAHNFVKNKATELVAKNLNGTLNIGSVDGDLWKEILITDVLLSDPDTVFSADTIYVNYDVWSFFKDIYQINEVHIKGVNSLIEEREDSTFNVQHLVKESPEEETGPLNIRFSKISLRDINSRVSGSHYFPDSVLVLNSLDADLSVSIGDSLGLTLSSLDFQIKEGRLPEPIKFSASAGYADEQVSLNQLVIETGRTYIKTHANADISDSTFTADVSSSPFSMLDVRPYLDYPIPYDEVDFELSISGSLKNLSIKLIADHPKARNVELSTILDLSSDPVAHNFGILSGPVDVGYFLGDSISASVQDSRITVSGLLSRDLNRSDAIWGFTFNELRYENYYVERLTGSGTLLEDDLIGHAEIHAPGRQEVMLNPALSGLLEEEPTWSLGASLRRIDLAYWLSDPELKSTIGLEVSAEGKGFTLSQNIIEFSVETLPVPIRGESEKMYVIADQQFTSFRIKGTLNEAKAEAKGRLRFIEDELTFEASIEDYLEEKPSYQYQAVTRGFDLREIAGFDDFPTSVNLKAVGEGIGFDPKESVVFCSVEIDSSIINGASFDQFTVNNSYSNGILTMTDGVLRSDIIEGTFYGKKNIFDYTDPNNRLSVDMEIKDLQPLAPLAGLDLLHATGSLKGDIIQDTSRTLKSNFEIDLENVQLDSIFMATRIHGEAVGSLEELRKFEMDLSINDPVFSGIRFQDVKLGSEGIANADTLYSKFILDVIGSSRGRLHQSGELDLSLEAGLYNINFDRFDIITSESELLLQEPFHVRYNNFAVGTDTLELRSSSGAFLEFSIPYADSVEQHAWVLGENFDFGLIQEVIFGERFLDGVLSGGLNMDKNADTLNGKGDLNLTRLNYNGVTADSLSFSFLTEKERLTANGSIYWSGEEKISGNLNIPFSLKSQEELEEAFFSRNISGELTVKPTRIEHFQGLLQKIDINETNGILSFNGQMSGTAGEPIFQGDIRVDEPVLSGIRFDLVTAGFNYDNQESEIKLNAELTAVQQKAASVSVNYPFAFDFRTMEARTASEDETITIQVLTEDFNIAVFNDFINKQFMKGLKGTLTADFSLKGTAGKMEPKGYIRLGEAEVSVPVAGIKLQKIRSDLEFTNNGLEVKELSATSGRGTFNANGNIGLKEGRPDNINLKANANQFRLANNQNYNLVIDLNSTISGNIMRPKATGKLSIRNGFVYLDDFGEKQVEDVHLEGESEPTFSPYDSLAIEMEFEINKNFFVRNRGYLGMEIELVGKLDARKETNGDLSLFGSLSGAGGYVRPLGKRFDLQVADLTFSGPPDNPDLNIKTKYTPPTRQKGEAIVVYYIIEGEAQDPDFRFESDPMMEESDIACYTLFSQPCISNDGIQNTFANSGTGIATDVLTDVLLNQVGAIATSKLGVDVVQIDNTGSGSQKGTSIKTGWYLNDRTFFAMVNEITRATPKMMFILEYILTENLDLIVVQGDDSRSGVDLRYQFDY